MAKDWKDPRYEVVHVMLLKNKIKVFSDIFQYVPVSVVAKHMRKNNEVVQNNGHNPGKWKVSEVITLAKLFDYSSLKMFQLMEKSITE